MYLPQAHDLSILYVLNDLHLDRVAGQIVVILFGENSSQKKENRPLESEEKVRGGTERKAPKWVDIACVNCFYVVAGK